MLGRITTSIFEPRRMAPILDRLGDRDGRHRLLAPAGRGDAGRDLDALTALGVALSADGDTTRRSSCCRDVASHRADQRLGARGSGDGAAGRPTARGRDRRVHGGAAPRPAIGAGLLRARARLSAARALARGGRVIPGSPKSWRPTRRGPFNLGLALAELGRPEEARRALLRAAALAPDDGGDPRRARSRCRAAAAPAPAAAAPAPRFIGDIKSFALPEVLEFLRLQHKTGSLVVSSRRGAGIVRLVKGQVTSASAPGVDAWAKRSSRADIITRAQLDAALARQRRDDAPSDGSETLGDLLLRERPGEPRAADARRVSAGAGCAGGDARLEGGRVLLPSRR